LVEPISEKLFRSEVAFRKAIVDISDLVLIDKWQDVDELVFLQTAIRIYLDFIGKVIDWGLQR